MILILIGISIGIRDRFQNPGSWILLLIGSIFLAGQANIGLDASKYLAPILLIFVGMIIILKPKRYNRRRDCFNGGKTVHIRNENTNPLFDRSGAQDSSEEEYVQINSVFGGVKKFIVSKNFKGGSVVTFMGGAELNLLQSDIQQPIIMEINNVFGGTKLSVPPNWDVKNEVTAIFGGVDDKRNINMLTPEPGKTLLIKGTSVFGGLEIANY